MRLDLANRRLRLPHSVVMAGVERAVAADPEISEFAIAADAEGYVASLTTQGEALTVVVRPTSLSYSEGAITLKAETPRGVRVNNRPAAHALIAALTIFFGGTPRGHRILSPGEIDGLEWDGLSATWTRPLDGVMASSGIIGSRAQVALVLDHTSEGLWLALPRGGAAGRLLPRLWALLGQRRQ